MKRDIEQIRKDIAKRKQQKHPRTTVSQSMVSDLVQDEEKHGYLPTNHAVKTIKTNTSQSVPGYILKTILAGVLFFTIAITTQWDVDWLTKPKQWTTEAFTEDFPFATVNAWYQDRFGAPFAFMRQPDVLDNTPAVLPVNGTISQSFDSNGQGVWISTIDQSDIYAIEQGTVLFAGNDKETNKTVIIQHPDKSKSIYGNLSEINVNPYQFVQANQVIAIFDPAEMNHDSMFFAIQKDQKYFDPIQVIHVDERS